MNNSGDRLFWGGLFILLAVVAGWNLVQNHQLQAQLEAGPNVEVWSARLGEIRAARAYALDQVGKQVQCPEGLEPMGDAVPSQDDGYRLILAIDEMSCDTCRDSETQFALGLAAETGRNLLTIVVHAETPRYVRSFMRLNAVDQPVYFDREGRFFSMNQVERGPLFLLVNPAGEVVAAHWPIPTQPEMSDMFHAMCYRLFGVTPPPPMAQTHGG